MSKIQEKENEKEWRRERKETYADQGVDIIEVALNEFVAFTQEFFRRLILKVFDHTNDFKVVFVLVQSSKYISTLKSWAK